MILIVIGYASYLIYKKYIAQKGEIALLQDRLKKEINDLNNQQKLEIEKLKKQYIETLNSNATQLEKEAALAILNKEKLLIEAKNKADAARIKEEGAIETLKLLRKEYDKVQSELENKKKSAVELETNEDLVGTWLFTLSKLPMFFVKLDDDKLVNIQSYILYGGGKYMAKFNGQIIKYNTKENTFIGDPSMTIDKNKTTISLGEIPAFIKLSNDVYKVDITGNYFTSDGTLIKISNLDYKTGIYKITNHPLLKTIKINKEGSQVEVDGNTYQLLIDDIKPDLTKMPNLDPKYKEELESDMDMWIKYTLKMGDAVLYRYQSFFK